MIWNIAAEIKQTKITMCMICSTSYSEIMKSAISANPNFSSIKEFIIAHFPKDGFVKYYSSLLSGTAILETQEQLNAYIACYGDIHSVKLHLAFDELFKDQNLHGKTVEVIDWGAGQALATCILVEYIRQKNVNLNIKKVILVEPSAAAIERGRQHIEAIYLNSSLPEIVLLNKKSEDVKEKEISKETSVTRLHLFSNILDMENINQEQISKTIKNSQQGENYFVCVSPRNGHRLSAFYESFYGAVLLSFKADSFLSRPFQPSAMKRCLKTVYRVHHIFKTSL